MKISSFSFLSNILRWRRRRTLFVLILVCRSIEQSQSSREQFKFKSEEGNLLPPPPLVYPFGATLKLLLGCTVPISMPGRILVYGQNFQFQFALPQNATFFSNYFNSKAVRRRRRAAIMAAERSIFYRMLEEELQSRGGPGKDCMKRSICESAETPLRDDGLMGEILHVLLTPDYGGQEEVGVDEEYINAAMVGRRGENCSEVYSSCPPGFGFLDHISKIFDHD